MRIAIFDISHLNDTIASKLVRNRILICLNRKITSEFDIEFTPLFESPINLATNTKNYSNQFQWIWNWEMIYCGPHNLWPQSFVHNFFCSFWYMSPTQSVQNSSIQHDDNNEWQQHSVRMCSCVCERAHLFDAFVEWWNLL